MQVTAKLRAAFKTRRPHGYRYRFDFFPLEERNAPGYALTEWDGAATEHVLLASDPPLSQVRVWTETDPGGPLPVGLPRLPHDSDDSGRPPSSATLDLDFAAPAGGTLDWDVGVAFDPPPGFADRSSNSTADLDRFYASSFPVLSADTAAGVSENGPAQLEIYDPSVLDAAVAAVMPILHQPVPAAPPAAPVAADAPVKSPEATEEAGLVFSSDSPAGPPIIPPGLLDGPADPLWVLDANDALVLTPGVTEHEFSTWGVDLRAQVSGGTVSTYSWDLTQAPDAVNVTGQDSYRLQFTWASVVFGPPQTNTITITATNTDLTQQTQTLTFSVTSVTSPAWTSSPPTSFSTWPTILPPDAVKYGQETVGGPGFSASLASGELFAGHTLPSYNPGVAPISLVYSSTAADPRPIFQTHYELNPSQAVPTRVSGRLTLNGVQGQEIWYDASLLNPGDIMQIALQGDTNNLVTGRYSYSIAVTAHYGTPVTTTYNGSVNIVNSDSGIVGDGWSIAGLERIWSVTGGVVLERPGGLSLWFADGAQSGTFVTPAGDFSTLVRHGDNTYTRTLKDGVKINYATDGKQTSIVDLNNNTLAFGYDGSGRLTTITDPNSLVTNLGYNGSNRVSSITDPAARVTQLGYNGQHRLTSITDPDPDGGGPLTAPVTSFGYDSSSGRMTSRTDPRNNATTFGYNFAGRVATITRPGTTAEQLTALQMLGLVNQPYGTPGNPATPVLAVEAQASYTDPRSKVWQSRHDWLGFGRPSQPTTPLGHMTVYHRNGSGLAWLAADPLARRDRYEFDSKGNPTKITLPDDNFVQYVYNGFSQPTQYTDPRTNVTQYQYDVKGNLTQLTEANPGSGSPIWTYTYTTDGWLSTLTDPLSRVTEYRYDTRDRLTQVIYPDGDADPNNNPKVLLASDSASNLTSWTNERNYVTAYAYDTLDRLTRITLPDADGDPNNNPKYDYTFDVGSNLLTAADPNTHTTSYAYDSRDRLTTVTEPDPDGGGPLTSPITTYVYDGSSNLTSVTDPLNRVMTYAYDDSGRNTSITLPDPDGGGPLTAPVYVYGYDAADQVTSVADPLNRTSTLTYNDRGWLTKVTRPLGDKDVGTYDANGNLTHLAIESPTGEQSFPVTFGYDALDRRTSTGDVFYSTWTTEFDAAGNVVTSTDPLAHATAYQYDARDRLTQVTQPDPDGGGPLAAPVTNIAYDAAGNRTSVTDPLNRVTGYTFDPQDRLTRITQPDPDGGGPLTTPLIDFTFDLEGRLTSVKDPVNNVTSYAYDNLDRVTGETDPRLETTQYVYDAGSQVTQVTDRVGRRRQFVYDNLGRQTQEKWLDSGGATVRTLSYVYNAASEVTAASDPDSVYAFAYNANGQLTSVDNAGTPGVPQTTLTYGYNPVGVLTSVADNRGGTTSFHYDFAGRLDDLYLTVSGTVEANVDFAYDAAYRLTGLSRTVDFSGGDAIETAFGYDDANRLTGITHISSVAGQLANYAYSYDAASQLTSYTGPEGTLNFAYDNTGQLTGVSGARTETYSYDVNGNRTLAGYVTTTGNRLSSDGTFNYTHDDEGNLLTKTRISDGQVTEYTWDHRNRLTQVLVKTSGGTVLAEERFTYDLFNRRLGVWLDADGAGSGAAVQTWTVYNGANTYADYSGAGSLTTRYLFGPGLDFLLARVSAGGDEDWYLTDHLGSVRQIVNTNGTVLSAITYDTFGKILTETNPNSGDRFKYTGREHDALLDQYYYRSRYYAASTGRFLSEDTIRFLGGDANLFRYVHNMPTGATDPTGKLIVELAIVAVAAAMLLWPSEANAPGPQDVNRSPKPGNPVGAALLVGGGPWLTVKIARIVWQLCQGGGGGAAESGVGGAAGQAGGGGGPIIVTPGLGPGTGPSIVTPSPGPLTPPPTQLPNPGPSGPPILVGPGLPAPKPQPGPAPNAPKAPTPTHPVPKVPGSASTSPGPDWTWRGKPGEPVGGDKGAWFNPKTGETLHPDLGHPAPVGPHWDWRAPDGMFWRIFPDGSVVPRP